MKKEWEVIWNRESDYSYSINTFSSYKKAKKFADKYFKLYWVHNIEIHEITNTKLVQYNKEGK